MESAIVEAATTEPVVGQAATTSPEPRAEMRVDPQPESWTEVIIREAMVEDVVPLCSAPMPDTGP
jgi:hypothetical protein